MSDQERPCGCLFKGYEVVSQCVYHTRRRRLIESLQRENEELRRIASEKHDEVLALEAAAITPEMRERWHRVATLNPAAGIVYNEPDEKWPEDGEWVLIEIESASGISYEARIHDERSWPSFGVRWAYISDLLGEQG